MSNVYHQHMTQRVPSDPHWRVNCTAYCAAMCINDSVLGGLYDVSGQRIRALSSEPSPDPASPGLSIKQVLSVAIKHYGAKMADRSGASWSEVMAALHNNARILLQIDYATLGSARCQANGDFGHAVVLVRDSGTNTILASDPLCSAPKNYSENALRAAATKFGNENGGHLWWAMTRPVPILR